MKKKIAKVEKKPLRRKQADEILRNEELYRMISIHCSFGIVHFDGNGVIVDCNERFLQIFDIPKEKLIGFNVAESLLDEGMRSTIIACLSGSPDYLEGNYRSSTDDGIGLIRGRFSRFTSEDGRSLGAVGLFEDISERMQAEDALRSSEEKLRQIIDLAPHIIFAIGRDGKYLLANKALAEACNTSVGALTGKSLADFHLYKSEVRNMLQGNREFIKKGNIKFIPEKSIIDAQGNRRFLQTTKVPFNLFGHKTPAVLGVQIDITERKRAEEALQAVHEQLKETIDFLPDATFVVDREGKVFAWNRAIEEMTGLRKEEIIGVGDHAYAVPFYGEPRPILIDFVMHAIEGSAAFYDSIEREGNLLSSEIFAPKIYGGKGAYLWGTAAPFFDVNERLIGAVETIRDITELKQIESSLLKREADLEEKADELEKINTALKTMLKIREEDKKEMEESLLSNVKESILPFLEKLNKTRLDEDQRAYLDIIQTRLNEVVSPFMRNLASTFTNLTPMEMSVATLIKAGKTSKEIAEILGVSELTILSHRNNLRAKLGLRNEKTNLRSCLMKLT